MLNVRQLVNIVLDSSTNYACWRDLMEQALQRYALLEHITDDAPSTDPGWIQMDSVILNWISNSISADLHQVVRERGCTMHHLWLAFENQFLGNCEHHTLHLDATFCTFVQGDLSVNEYCRKFKAMADGLADLSATVPTSCPGPRMEPLARRQLGPAVVGQLFELHGAPPTSYLGLGLGDGLQRDAPHHSISW
jgi:hypothetical protein